MYLPLKSQKRDNISFYVPHEGERPRKYLKVTFNFDDLSLCRLLPQLQSNTSGRSVFRLS